MNLRLSRLVRKHFANSSKGQIVNQLLPAVVIPILLIIMLIVFANFEGAMDHSSISSQASTTINKTRDNTYTGFNLGSILPLVIFGVVILGILISAFAFRR